VFLANRFDSDKAAGTTIYFSISLMNSSSQDSPFPMYPLPPPGLNYVAAIRPSLIAAIIGTTFSSMLVPLFVALLCFSNAQMRRRPVFILNICAVVLGFAMGQWNTCLAAQSILNPWMPISQGVYYAFQNCYSILPYLVEAILLFRVYSVFHPRTTRLSTIIYVFLPTTILKLTRLSFIIIFMIQWAQLTTQVGDAAAAGGMLWADKPYIKITWLCELFDNAYVSLIFLWRLHNRHARPVASSHPGASKNVVADGLRILFYASTSNFVLPVILNIVQIVLLFGGGDSSGNTGTYVQMVNVYVSIISVVFATLWSAAASHVAETHHHSEQFAVAPWRLSQPILQSQVMDISGKDTTLSCKCIGMVDESPSRMNGFSWEDDKFRAL